MAYFKITTSRGVSYGSAKDIPQGGKKITEKEYKASVALEELAMEQQKEEREAKRKEENAQIIKTLSADLSEDSIRILRPDLF